MNHTFLEGKGQLERVIAFMTELEREPPQSSSHRDIKMWARRKVAKQQQSSSHYQCSRSNFF